MQGLSYLWGGCWLGQAGTLALSPAEGAYGLDTMWCLVSSQAVRVVSRFDFPTTRHGCWAANKPGQGCGLFWWSHSRESARLGVLAVCSTGVWLQQPVCSIILCDLCYTRGWRCFPFSVFCWWCPCPRGIAFAPVLPSAAVDVTHADHCIDTRRHVPLYDLGGGLCSRNHVRNLAPQKTTISRSRLRASCRRHVWDGKLWYFDNLRESRVRWH